MILQFKTMLVRDNNSLHGLQGVDDDALDLEEQFLGHPPPNASVQILPHFRELPLPARPEIRPIAGEIRLLHRYVGEMSGLPLRVADGVHGIARQRKTGETVPIQPHIQRGITGHEHINPQIELPPADQEQNGVGRSINYNGVGGRNRCPKIDLPGV